VFLMSEDSSGLAFCGNLGMFSMGARPER